MHLRPISIFSIRAGDGSFAPLLPRVSHEEPAISSSPARKSPSGAAPFDGAPPMALPVESSAAPQHAANRRHCNTVQNIVPDVKLLVSHSSQPSIGDTALRPLRIRSPLSHRSHHSSRPLSTSQDIAGSHGKGRHPSKTAASR